MTIKKRLFCSNILMIAVPAAIAALIGLVCLGLLWFILHGGGGMHLEDGEDFSRLGRSVTRQLQGCLADDPDTWTGRIGGLESMTESGALRIVVVRDGVPAYAAGEERPGDSRLARPRTASVRPRCSSRPGSEAFTGPAENTKAAPGPCICSGPVRAVWTAG